METRSSVHWPLTRILSTVQPGGWLRRVRCGATEHKTGTTLLRCTITAHPGIDPLIVHKDMALTLPASRGDSGATSPHRSSEGITRWLNLLGEALLCLARTVVCLAAALGLFSTPQPLQSQSMLVSHWELDEGVGEATTDSAASRTGALENGAAWASGRSGSAVSMDGIDDFIALPALEVTGSAITLAAWVRNSSFPSNVRQRFISKANDSSEQGAYWMLGQINDGENRLRFRLRANRLYDDVDRLDREPPC